MFPSIFTEESLHHPEVTALGRGVCENILMVAGDDDVVANDMYDCCYYKALH